ncbi:hypothetical protein BGZ54_005910 [Gamsiella multidivaricata]|nr:hypothetical protein BGZ54_005910 [Gamsiella multidivaricata]
MGNQHSKRLGSKGNRSSTILDPNVHPLSNNNNSNNINKDKERKSKSKDRRKSSYPPSPHEQQSNQHSNNSNSSNSSNSSNISTPGDNGRGTRSSGVNAEVNGRGHEHHQQGHNQNRTSREAHRSSWQGPSATTANQKTATTVGLKNGIDRPVPVNQTSLGAVSREYDRSEGGAGSATAATKGVTASAAAAAATAPVTITTAATITSSTTTAAAAGERVELHRTVPPQSIVNNGGTNNSSALDGSSKGLGSTTRESTELGSQARHSLDTLAQTNHNQTRANGKGSDQQPPQAQARSSEAVHGQNHAAGDSRNDTQLPHQQQPSPQKQQGKQQQQDSFPSFPAPNIPFAVSTPGNPILVKKHNLAPLTIASTQTSSLLGRSPPSLSPKSGSHRKSAELSPTARLPFLGPSVGDKTNKGGLDLDDMISRLLDAGYSGKISKGVCLKNSEILVICQAAREIFLSQPTLIELHAPVKIVGDIHGQYTDLLRLFEMCGFPPSANFLFLGDYVDRGKMSLETILLLFCYKIKYPENFFLLRGNHECANVTRVYGFYDECKRRASIKMWKAFVDVFNCLPLAAIVANKIFCVHGGLSPNLSSMDDIRALRRPTDVPDYGLLNDLLWSDPSDTALDWEDNERGVSYCFGKSIIQRFLNRHDFDLVCRAHMVVEDGYEFFNDRTLVTVFSAPNYCGEFDNYGAVMSVNEDLLCSFELLKPIDPATARAQMQSLAANSGGWRANKQRLR